MLLDQVIRFPRGVTVKGFCHQDTRENELEKEEVVVKESDT